MGEASPCPALPRVSPPCSEWGLCLKPGLGACGWEIAAHSDPGFWSFWGVLEDKWQEPGQYGPPLCFWQPCCKLLLATGLEVRTALPRTPNHTLVGVVCVSTLAHTTAGLPLVLLLWRVFEGSVALGMGVYR